MLSDNIITGRLISEVSRSLLVPASIAETHLDTMEPEIRCALQKVCEQMVEAMVDVRSMRTDSLSIEEIVNMSGPKFFMIGLITAMIARDQMDETQVPSLAEYCQTFAGISRDVKNEMQKRLKKAVSEQREKQTTDG